MDGRSWAPVLIPEMLWYFIYYHQCITRSNEVSFELEKSSWRKEIVTCDVASELQIFIAEDCFGILSYSSFCMLSPQKLIKSPHLYNFSVTTCGSDLLDWKTVKVPYFHTENQHISLIQNFSFQNQQSSLSKKKTFFLCRNVLTR